MNETEIIDFPVFYKLWDIIWDIKPYHQTSQMRKQFLLAAVSESGPVANYSFYSGTYIKMTLI